MKTNQVLTRPMGDFKVLQRTSDGMFNATELLKQWNINSCMHKEMKHYFENKSTNEFIKALMLEENLHGRNSAYVKSKASRGDNAGTWMHPLLFIDFAMWINPSFKVKVLRFVYDQLVKYRIEAGDAYIEMCNAVSTIIPKHLLQQKIKDLARSLNIIIYGYHESNVRNKVGDEEKAHELLSIEREIARLIKKGYIKDINGLREYIVSEWRDRHEPKLLTA